MTTAFCMALRSYAKIALKNGAKNVIGWLPPMPYKDTTKEFTEGQIFELFYAIEGTVEKCEID